MRELNRPWPKSNISSKGGQDTSTFEILDHSFRAISWECSETQICPVFTKFLGLCDLEIWRMTLKK